MLMYLFSFLIITITTTMIRMTVASANKTPRTIAGVLLQPSADKTTATTNNVSTMKRLKT